MHLFLFNIDWHSAFLPTISIAEIILRGTLMYLGIFAILRFVLKREAGTVGMGDLLMMVLLADVAQNAMASEYKSVREGIILVSTIIFWNFAFDWLGYRFSFFHRFVHPPAIELVKEGRMLRCNLQAEMITADELLSQAREQGVETIEQIKIAHLEGDGRISVIPREEEGGGGGAGQKRGRSRFQAMVKLCAKDLTSPVRERPPIFGPNGDLLAWDKPMDAYCFLSSVKFDSAWTSYTRVGNSIRRSRPDTCTVGR